jgi:xanthine dehydrogenase accessory factor
MASDAKMLVTAGGRQWGTVGGGCVEADVTEQALSVARRHQPTFVRHTLNADTAGDIGLSCGGTVEFFLEPVMTDMGDLYSAVAEGIEGRSPVTVVTGIDWADGPRKTARVGHHALAVGERYPELEVFSDGPRQAVVVDEELAALVERIPRVPRVIIFGAGHVGAEVARVAHGAGFHVVISDDRGEFANRGRLPWADEVIAEDFRSLLDRFEFDEDDFVLATTRGHSYDAYIVERTARSRAGYVGMLGSKRKRAVIWRTLEKAGMPRDKLDRVRSPIGLEIGADTPSEIAVSVVAELIRVRRLGEG